MLRGRPEVRQERELISAVDFSMIKFEKPPQILSSKGVTKIFNKERILEPDSQIPVNETSMI